MEQEIKISKKIFIRKAGKDEYWLQDLIYNDPKILGLGNLVTVNKEKTQSKGGRLDILLKDPEDNSMYEVEIMLGETDPSHIIRCIEYWDNEKRKYPQRQHFCVLLAESFDRRYFNVIQILSLNIPMIAVQADLLEVGNDRILNFTKIVDIYNEPEEDEGEIKQVNESTWLEFSPWTSKQSKLLFDILESKSDRIVIRYTQSYISITIDGRNEFWLCKRTDPTSALFFNVKDDEKADLITTLLKENNIGFNYNRYKEFMIITDDKFFTKQKELILAIHAIRYKKVIAED